MTGKQQWRLSFWPVIAFCAVLPALIALGVWQVQRGIEKRATYDRFLRASLMDATMAGNLSLAQFNDLQRYRRIAMRGQYLAERQFLLDNMPHDGRPGHHVLTPFLPVGARYVVMVDRGWRPGLAMDVDENPPAERGVTLIHGMLAAFPQPALDLRSENATVAWPRVVQFPSADELAGMLGQPVANSRLLLGADAADGFVREWTPPGIPPARHYAYAFQWFGLAAALIVIFLVLARPHRREETQQ